MHYIMSFPVNYERNIREKLLRSFAKGLKKSLPTALLSNDEAMKLVPPKILTLEQAIEFINDDELVEITPTDIRVRKKYLTAIERRKHARELGKIENESDEYQIYFW